jgi:hypothetical protein
VKRRDFIRLLSISSPAVLCSCCALQYHPFQKIGRLFHPDHDDSDAGGEDFAEVKAPETAPKLTPQQMSDELLKDARAKSVYFSQDFPDDLFFEGEKFDHLKALTQKFRAVQRHVGNGNFNLVGIDDFFRYTQYSAGTEKVTAKEKAFLEELFFFDATKYGFYGDKVFHQFTDTIKPKEVSKVPYTGHFLKKEDSLPVYEKITKDIGKSIILTSGVRSMAKQFHLFMEKGLETKGNMSKASRSLAPPGYSFHGKFDFDVGRVGYGLKNFTDDFAETDEYKHLLDLGYIQIRYTQQNLLGVRFEPWHIKVSSNS